MTHDDAGPSVASAGSHGLSEAEIDALEYVIVEGRIACMEDYGILRSLLVRVRPEWETNHDAAPTATARTDSATGEPGGGHGSGGTDKPVTRPVLGIGDTFSPFAKRENDRPDAIATPQQHATPGEGTSRGGCTLTTYERDVLQRMLEYQQRLAGDATEPRGWMAIQADTDADILMGLIARLT